MHRRPAGRQAVARPSGRLRRNRAEIRAAYGFLLPWIIGFVVFMAVPMVISLYLSFTAYDQINAPRYVGTENYRQLISDPKVALALRNTLIYAVLYVPTAMVVALGLAMVLHRVGRAAGFFRTVFYLPVMTPTVAAAALFLLLLNGQRGLVTAAWRCSASPGRTGPPTAPGSSRGWR